MNETTKFISHICYELQLFCVRQLTLSYSESCIWILKNLHKAIEIGTLHSNFNLIIHGEL
jgi:hypothetical protein